MPVTNKLIAFELDTQIMLMIKFLACGMMIARAIETMSNVSEKEYTRGLGTQISSQANFKIVKHIMTPRS